jgi:taurine--2-oxoglutarate transaminase
MTGDAMISLAKRHTLLKWSAPSEVDPIPVAGTMEISFWIPEGKRFIDFNNQRMSVNIGQGDERVINVITEQAQTLVYANPFMAAEPRGRRRHQAG